MGTHLTLIFIFVIFYSSFSIILSSLKGKKDPRPKTRCFGKVTDFYHQKRKKKKDKERKVRNISATNLKDNRFLQSIFLITLLVC